MQQCRINTTVWNYNTIDVFLHSMWELYFVNCKEIYRKLRVRVSEEVTNESKTIVITRQQHRPAS
jgi:hypothetical protein